METNNSLSLSKFSFIFSVILLIFGGVFTFLGTTFRQQQAATQGWPAVQGTISNAYVHYEEPFDTEDTPSYSPVIVYEYTVNGQVYSSTQLNIGFERSYGAQREADEALAEYPVGGAVTVYYDPANPGNAVLDRASNGNQIVLIAGIGMLTIGMIALILTFWLRSSRQI